MTTTAPEAVLSALRDGRRFLLTSHANPDGDAIGSALGMAQLLRSMGKSATIWLHDPPPRAYRAVPGADRMHVGTEPPDGFPEQYDTAVVLECPSLERCGLESAIREVPVIVNIDHHLGNAQYGNVNWVDTAAPSLGELLYHLARSLHVRIDARTATQLLMTIVTDTGGFRFSNATDRAFDSAAALVRSGADPETVSGWVYESQPEGALRLVAEMLGTLRLDFEGRVATALVTRDMFERAGAEPGDTEGLVDFPRSIEGVEVVALVREVADREAKISLRSRGAFSVERIASRHDGGGHRNAAGCRMARPALEARDAIATELGQALADADSNHDEGAP